jgi:hypothetical protein
MIRTVFYIGSLLVISFFLYNQYLDFKYYIDTPIINSNYIATKKVKIAMSYHGIKMCTMIQHDGKDYYIFIRDGKVFDLFDTKQFPGLRRKLNE